MMPLEEIVVLLRWLAAVATAVALGLTWFAVTVLTALDRLSARLDCAIQQADESSQANTLAGLDDSKVPELDPWHAEHTVADLVARSE